MTHNNVTPFYPRRGRQWCTLRHVMPLYNVHPLFTNCVISPIPAILCATRELNPSLLSGNHICDHSTNETVFSNSSRLNDWVAAKRADGSPDDPTHQRRYKCVAVKVVGKSGIGKGFSVLVELLSSSKNPSLRPARLLPAWHGMVRASRGVLWYPVACSSMSWHPAESPAKFQVSSYFN
ncbi:hypothetical protein SFRURICE_018232 [Spodoptera frugiperda]|nr:hypothetical protein SFRURICE_018232 [Spodoptera frugiperda]